MQYTFLLRIAACVLLLVTFVCLPEKHIYPQNKTILDPVKMLLPFCKEKPNSTTARTILFCFSVSLSALIFLQ